MTPACPEDRAWIEATLRARVDTSMFPLGNLARHGWESDAPRAMRFWIDRPRGAVLGTTVEGMLMPHLPDADTAGAVEALAGCTAIGAAGEAREVRALLDATRLAKVPAKLDGDEPQLGLALRDLVVPEGPGNLIPLGEADRATVTAWRAAYLVEAVGEEQETAQAQAARDIARYIRADTHRVLVEGRRHLALTGFNAALPDIVQIGGVYTPPELRARGHGRRAVALHLLEARGRGAERATLFASGPAAVRAYTAIGFMAIGSFALVVFRNPERIGP